MIDTSSIAKGVVLKFKDGLYLVTDFQHVNPGKGSAFVRTRLKNIATGKSVDQTYKAGEAIDIVDVEKRRMQYLYKDESNLYFMDNNNYEQVQISKEMVGAQEGFIKEGQEVMIITHEGAPITMELPKKITLKITDTVPGVKGDTASGNVTKEATLETGAKIRIPLFVKAGESIVINTETGEYAERA